MPSRPVTAIIVLFWLGTLGWFGFREVWPKIRPGEAPPFVIDLADEATSQVAFANEKLRPADALWQIYRGDEKIGKAQTRLLYRASDDTFELQTRVIELVLIKKLFFVSDKDLLIPEMINSYRLSRAGELQGIEMTGTMVIGKMEKGKIIRNDASADAEFTATVRNGRMYWTGKITIPDSGLDPIEPIIDPVPAPQGIFLNPMHPVPRVKGLRPGRRWQMPVVDPLAHLVGPVMQAVQLKINPKSKPIPFPVPAGPKTLAAEVLSEPTTVVIDGHEHECFVIEYRSDDQTFRTYVRRSDGNVLRQESQAPGGRFVIQRQ
jgi:hypothetical protein